MTTWNQYIYIIVQLILPTYWVDISRLPSLPMLQQPLEAVLAPGNNRCSNEQAAGYSQQAIFISDSNSALSVMWHSHSGICHHYTDGILSSGYVKHESIPLFEQPLFDFLTNGCIIGRYNNSVGHLYILISMHIQRQAYLLNAGVLGFGKVPVCLV